MTIVDAF